MIVPLVGDEGRDSAVAALRAGEAVVVPTDTLYGLAALPTVPGAVDRLFALKGRPADMPIAVLVADLEQVEALADLPDAARRLAAAFWPGPLTMVLARRAGVDLPLGEPHETIGVRWPAHPVIAALAADVGPLATTSANRTGEPTPEHAADAAAALTGAVAVVIEGGRCAGSASTVVDLTGAALRVLREGAITEAELRAALG
jgi:L-threonylcarbamoyladenylate synthase